MLQFNKLFTVTLLLALVNVGLVAADLQSDLEAFGALIPRRRIGFIAARHYLGDQSFRLAWTYVHSGEFGKIFKQIREATEVVEILEFVSREVDIYSLVDSIPNHVRSFEIPMKMPPDEALTQRNLASFLRDVIRALPRASISALMSRKVMEDGDFAKLYHVLKTKEFRTMVEKARNSESLLPAIEQLTSNSIDVDHVIKTGFLLLTWGP